MVDCDHLIVDEADWVAENQWIKLYEDNTTCQVQGLINAFSQNPNGPKSAVFMSATFPNNIKAFLKGAFGYKSPSHIQYQSQVSISTGGMDTCDFNFSVIGYK
jgi:hypothetical protein